MEDVADLALASERVGQQVRGGDAHCGQVVGDDAHIVLTMHITLGNVGQEHQLHARIHRRAERLGTRVGTDGQTDDDVGAQRHDRLHVVGLLGRVELGVGLRNDLDPELRESVTSALADRVGERPRRVPQQRSRMTARLHLSNLIITQRDLAGSNRLLTTRPLSPRRLSHRHSRCLIGGFWRCLGCRSSGRRCRVVGIVGACRGHHREHCEQRHDRAPTRSASWPLPIGCHGPSLWVRFMDRERRTIGR